MTVPVVLGLEGSVSLADVAGLCARLRDELGAQPRLVVCDVGSLAQADAVTVEALARLQLTARRCGSRIVLRRASGELRSLLDVAGLSDAVPLCPDELEQ